MPKAKIGEIVHYFDKISVAVLKVTAGSVKAGDSIQLGDDDTGFTQVIESMQVEHASVPSAKKGDEVGLKVQQPVKKGELVYKA